MLEDKIKLQEIIKDFNPAEKKVLKELLEIDSKPQIAEKLNMSYDNIKRHSSSIYKKLNVKGHIEIVYHRLIIAEAINQ